MSANIFGNRFFGHREPAWHGLGYVTEKDMTANEVLSIIGRYEFVKRPFFVQMNGKLEESKEFAIVRTATPDDPIERSFGTVTEWYNIIQPSTIATLFDDNVGQPVETMGSLGKGEKLFLSWKLPTIDIHGDEVKMYGLVVCGYNGKYGANLHLTTIRTVCQNTLNIAVGENNELTGAGRVWSGRHNSKQVENQLGLWMEHIQEQAEEQAQITRNLFMKLDTVRIPDENLAKSLFANIYPMPLRPSDNMPKELLDDKLQKFEKEVEQVEKHRSLAYDLFAGAGTAINDTAYGLLNAVTEYENWGGTIKKPINYSVMFGNRSNNMVRALNVVRDYAMAEK